MITVPQGFVLIEQGPLTLVLQQDYCERFLQCGLDDPERLCAQQTGIMHSGRGSMPTIEFESPLERIIVRKYRRGGLLRFFNADIFLGSQRAFSELVITVHAKKAGIPVADILGALSLRVCGPLYRHYLVSRELTDCCDLPAWFQHQGAAGEDGAALARCVAERVRHMHACGLYHADLNLKNILVSRTDVRRIFIIDWDKSAHRPGPLGLDECQRNVVRFCRSAEKLRSLHGIPIPARFVDIFLEHYWDNPALADLSRRLLRRALKGRKFLWRFSRRSS